MVGEHWIQRFLERHPEYYKRKQKPLAAEQKNAHNVEDMMDHFQKFQAVRTEKGIVDDDI